VAVSDLVGDDRGVDEQRSGDAALVAGHLRADVDEWSLISLVVVRGPAAAAEPPQRGGFI